VNEFFLKKKKKEKKRKRKPPPSSILSSIQHLKPVVSRRDFNFTATGLFDHE